MKKQVNPLTTGEEKTPENLKAFGMVKTIDGLWHLVEMNTHDGKLTDLKVGPGDTKMEIRLQLKEKVAMSFFLEE